MHTKAGFRQYDKEAVVVADGVTHLDGDFIVTNYAGPAACIQAAIDSISGTTGGTVYIRAGSYTLEDEIDLAGSARMVIRGDGIETQLHKSAGSNASVLNVGDIGAVTITVTLAPGYIIFTRSAGVWAAKPQAGETIYIPATSNFAAANQGRFQVQSSSDTFIQVYENPIIGPAGAAEGPIAIGAVDDISVMHSAFNVTQDNVVLEDLCLIRDVANSHGPLVYLRDGTEDITVRGCTLEGDPTTFGVDILKVAETTQDNLFIFEQNQFTGNSDPIDGSSTGVLLVGDVHFATIDSNEFGSGYTGDGGRRILAHAIHHRSGTYSTATDHLRITNNRAHKILMGDGGLAWPVGSRVYGIVLEGGHHFFTIANNDIYLRSEHNNAALRGIIIDQGSYVSSFLCYSEVSNNKVYITRGASGTTNIYDTVFSADFLSGGLAEANGFVISNNEFLTSNCDCSVAVECQGMEGLRFSGNNIRVNADHAVYLHTLDDFVIANNNIWQGSSGTGMACYTMTDGIITGNQSETASTTGTDAALYLNAVNYVTVTGNMLQAAYGNALSMWGACARVTVTGNMIQTVAGTAAALKIGGSSLTYSSITGNLILCPSGVLAVSLLITPTRTTLGPNQVFPDKNTANVDPTTGFNVNKQIVKAWAQASSGGVIPATDGGYNLTCSLSAPGSGRYNYTFVRNMKSVDYAVMATASGGTGVTNGDHICTIANKSASGFSVCIWDVSASANQDHEHYVVVCGISND